MAFRPKGFGLSAEVDAQMKSKYNLEEAKQAMEYIKHYVPDFDAGTEFEADVVQSKLKDGRALCQLMNGIQEGSVNKINNSPMAFTQMENIGKFLDAAKAYGVKETDLFQTVSLFEGTNMAAVIMTIHALGRKAGSKGKHGIGPKEADQNARQFTEEQRRAGEGVIGLQMGSNKGASQAGQNFGKTRQIID